jgi:hypothetical protein
MDGRTSPECHDRRSCGHQELADEAAADSTGIGAAEINEEVGSVIEVIFDAMQHRDGSLAD